MSSDSAIKSKALEMRQYIKQDNSRNALLTSFGVETLDRAYKLPGETNQDVFARVAGYYADDADHAQRLYNYISKLWFMPATPILSNGGTTRGLPISCYLNSVEDSMEGIMANFVENAYLASRGGGIGTSWSNVRSIGERVRGNGETTGIVPFLKVQDSMTLAISQGSLRRGSAAIYLEIWHPEIEEFLDMRRPTGGDPNRKALNLHHGVVVNDAFMKAVENDEDYNLISPKTGETIKTVRARTLWNKLLATRMETGEPYILFIDAVNEALPEHQKKLGLKVTQSNLCVEITLPTGVDYQNVDRTAVCCLSSLNLEKVDEWWDEREQMIQDILRMLDNVLEDFIENAPAEMHRAIYSAMSERSVGLGVMGWHALLQQRGIPFESDAAAELNEKIFSDIKRIADETNVALAYERGPCPDADKVGIMKRFSNMLAIAPTASISIICGQTSPAIEPWKANAYLQKTLSGSFIVRNRYLERYLEEVGLNTKEVWADIIAHGGSVQHLGWMEPEIRAVFKTAIEIDQMALIKLAAQRQPYICQSQSLNLFLSPTIHKRELLRLHMEAWKLGVKSLYYCRSEAVKRAEAINVKLEVKAVGEQEDRFEACAACQ